MKVRSLFLLILIIPIFFGLIIDSSDIIYSGKTIYKYQVEDYLNSVIDTNGVRINDFIYEIKEDILFLAQSERVKKILNKEVGESEKAAVIGVNGKADIISREIENYIRAHPDMTLSDLQRNNEFQKIAVQKVGLTGYSLLLDAKDMTIYFHINPKMVGYNEDDLVKISKDIVKIFYVVRDKGSSRGFYDWIDINGNKRKKYTEAKKIGVKTADGISLISLTTAYIDDYIVAKNVSRELDEYFKEFILKRSYQNILFISPNEDIVYMANFGRGIGLNGNDIGEDFFGLNFSTKKRLSNGLVFYGPFIINKDSSLGVAAVLSVYEGGKRLGFIVMTKSINDINDILSERYGEDENYLVDKNAMLLTPLKSRDVDLLTQEVRTESVEECLGDFEDAKRLGVSIFEYDKLEAESGEKENLVQFLDFKGDSVFGLERPIGLVHWCLISEINTEKILSKPMREGIWSQIKFRVIVVSAVNFLIVIISFFIDKEYIFKRKVKKEPRYNLLNQIVDFLRGKVGLFWLIFISIGFLILYFFILMKFFTELKIAIFFNIFPYIVALVISFILFVYGFRLKSDKGWSLILGAGCLVLSGLIGVLIIQYWIVVRQINISWWAVIIFLNTSGFLFLLNFFRRMK